MWNGGFRPSAWEVFSTPMTQVAVRPPDSVEVRKELVSSPFINPDIAIEFSARLVILILYCVSRYFFVLDVHQVRLCQKAPSFLPKVKIPAPII